MIVAVSVLPAFTFHQAFTWFHPEDFRWWFMVVPGVHLFLIVPYFMGIAFLLFFLESWQHKDKERS